MRIHRPFEFGNLSCWSGLIALAISMTAGCEPSETDLLSGVSASQPEPRLQLPDVPDSAYRFAPGVMLLASGEPISVESPGYACPTIADFDGDGVDDLVVGQFNGGKMSWYKNVASSDKAPKYASHQWIKTGDKPAEVPGVS